MSQVELDTETKNVSISYVKAVSMERYLHTKFEIFQDQCSPNLLNRINKHLLFFFIKKHQKVKGEIFSGGSDPKVKIILEKEVYNLSKFLVLLDKSVQEVLFEEHDLCEGLYIV